jgi:aspartate aminotransferase-like enzyme
MKTYKYSYFPGPSSVPENILQLGLIDYGSGDVEPDFLELYNKTVVNLQKLYNTDDDVCIMSGEGMLALWGALKSSLVKGDKVLVIATGLFGEGTADMVKSFGCEAKLIAFPNNSTFEDYNLIEQAIKEFKPKMITAVHCETPSGILNDLSVLGKLKKQYNVPLFYVDAVASLGGAHVDAKKHNIDFCLGGSQKVLSCPPNSCFTTVSDKAWEIIEQVNYQGYDSLLPFKNVKETGAFPYTPSWVNLAQLFKATQDILDEGLDNAVKRHYECAELVRKCIKEKGYKLFPKSDEFSSPTVTAVYVPENTNWVDFDKKFREKGVVFGGNYGDLAGKVFRIGHMGSQAKLEHVKKLCSLM